MTITHQPHPNFYCTDWSLAIDEPLAGTAVFSKVWLFLEYNQPWAAKATVDNSLPSSVQAWLAEQEILVNGRLQFIKQPRGTRTDWRFFVACFSPTNSRVYRFELTEYEELFKLNLPDIVAGEASYAPYLTTETQLLVCTNGKRDVCCALHGMALLRSLAVELGASVWETTHLGGHRFAPTLLTLPDGLNYGRINPQDVPQLLAQLQNQTLWLEKLRGRACYTPVEQVAEQFLRQKTGELRVDAYQHVGTQIVTGEAWQVQFQVPDGSAQSVTVEAAAPLLTYPSSGQLTTKTVPQFHCNQSR